jgi:hypothetical protein
MVTPEQTVPVARDLILEAIEDLMRPENRHKLIIALAQAYPNTPVFNEDVQELRNTIHDISVIVHVMHR